MQSHRISVQTVLISDCSATILPDPLLRVFTCAGRSNSNTAKHHAVTGWVRIPFTDVIRTSLISMLIPAQMHLPEGVRGPDGFLSEFSLPQGNPTQPVTGESVGLGWLSRTSGPAQLSSGWAATLSCVDALPASSLRLRLVLRPCGAARPVQSGDGGRALAFVAMASRSLS